MLAIVHSYPPTTHYAVTGTTASAERTKEATVHTSLSTTPTDPLSGPTPPPVVGRYRAANGTTSLALRAPVWHDGGWATCFDRSFAAGRGRLAPHRHDRTSETFFVRSGVARYLFRGRLRTAHAGEVVVIDPGTAHMDPWADADGPLEVTVLLAPADPTWLEFGMRLGEAIQGGPLNRQGQMPLPALMGAVHRSGADVFAAGLPAGLQRRVTTPALSLLVGLIGGRS